MTPDDASYWRGCVTGIALLGCALILWDWWTTVPLPPLEPSHGPLEFRPAPPGWEHAIPPTWQRAPLILMPPCTECLWL
jgi:hypothetical protein